MTIPNSNSSPADENSGRNAFWSQAPTLPSGLELTQLEPVIVPRRGRGGESVFDIARLKTPVAVATLVIAFRSSVVPQDVVKLRDQLRTVIDDLRLRNGGNSVAPPTYIPAIATDIASASVVDACVREGVAVLDRRGTVIVHQGPAYVHVVGNAAVDRPTRVRLFSGKACRIVRFVLAHPDLRVKPQEAATGAKTSYAFAHGVLTKLEREGYVARKSPRSGFRLRDGSGLLRAWTRSGERTAARVTPYFAPNTRPEALAAAAEASRAAGVQSVFSLASALLPPEVFASGLPHGVYVSGDVAPFEDALDLKRTTPHNFLVLRADPAADTAAGGIYAFTRTLPHGHGVSLPQLAVDLAGVGGRGDEQSERLIEIFAKGLPPPELEP
jgi:hypothetical protein